MIIRADLGERTVALLEPDDFQGFHVAVVGDDETGLAEVLAPYGALDGDHAWLRLDAVTALAGAAADEAWQEGFEAMVTYASHNGFLDAEGRSIRAHLERVDS